MDPPVWCGMAAFIVCAQPLHSNVSFSLFQFDNTPSHSQSCKEMVFSVRSVGS